jgi:hypothetical protein
MEISVAAEIKQVEVGKPHVVILGAGASYAAFQNGDKNGKKLPLMNNFIETLGIEKLIEQAELITKSSNFEDIYSEIHKNPELASLQEELEKEVYNYFQDMELLEKPTIYDHLVLSLRSKDLVATFNWDPFLVQAIRRNGKRFKLPRVLFLHGNVEVGYCKNGHMMGNNGDFCHKCDQPLTPTNLLYPVAEKNYHLDKFISRQWETLEESLKHAFMVTIFGYGAPVSDTRAVELLKKGWGSTDSRKMEQFEIIDVRNKDDLTSTWSPFIYSHHFKIENNFYNSWIANHPRRTYEAYQNQYMNAMFIENNSIPRDADFEQLWEWYDKLQDVENAQKT